ncbi:hypothetical protein BXZ70DRAFT_944800 [Cristinia sonorae]|uniref:Transmembrane protein n=1 Tax=Cristinia sonorae TaxID=1940300 RepID=A0A8K0ULL9_9AGAR|nr:hypothetical protein BXZ70DRAFT_944800 [Cristinia sonorae]
MLSFKSLAIAAAVAFGAISTVYAAPAVSSDVAVARDVVAIRGVAAIVAEVHAKVTPFVAQLHTLTVANATVEVVHPIVTEIKDVVAGAVVEVVALAGAKPSVILASVDGTVQVTVVVLAKLIADLLILIFGALGFVLSVCDVSLVAALIPCLCIVADILGCLICAIFSLCGGLLVGLVGAVVALIGAILPIIARLNVVVLVSIFAGVKL